MEKKNPEWTIQKLWNEYNTYNLHIKGKREGNR